MVASNSPTSLTSSLPSNSQIDQFLQLARESLLGTAKVDEISDAAAPEIEKIVQCFRAILELRDTEKKEKAIDDCERIIQEVILCHKNTHLARQLQEMLSIPKTLSSVSDIPMEIQDLYQEYKSQFTTLPTETLLTLAKSNEEVYKKAEANHAQVEKTFEALIVGKPEAYAQVLYERQGWGEKIHRSLEKKKEPLAQWKAAVSVLKERGKI